MLGCPVAVLHRVEGSEDSTQVPVANALGIPERILVKSALPEPLTVKSPRVGEVGHVQVESPRGFREGHGLGLFRPRPHIAHTHPALRGHLVIRPGEEPDRSVSCPIDEELACETGGFTASDVKGMHGFDPLVLGLDLEGMVVEE